MPTSTSTGTSVQTTSISTLCVVFEGTGFAPRRKRIIDQISSANTKAVMTPMMRSSAVLKSEPR